jgi:hypothetical protein
MVNGSLIIETLKLLAKKIATELHPQGKYI